MSLSFSKKRGFTRTPKLGVTPKGGGFTLIELLVVVAIISLLASVVMASLNSARAKARDTKRFSDLHQMQIALDLYYNTNGIYPKEICYPNLDSSILAMGWAADSGSGSGSLGSCWLDLQTKLSPYISKLPQDPTPAREIYWYADLKNEQGYLLATWPEVSSSRGDKCYYPDYGYYCLGENWR